MDCFQFINLFSLLGAIMLRGGDFHAVFENVETGKTHVVWRDFAFSNRVKILSVGPRRQAVLDCKGERMRVDFWPSRKGNEDYGFRTDDTMEQGSEPTPEYTPEPSERSDETP